MDSSHRLSWIEVAGFKSHFSKHRVDLRPLTILCGANSSGKSSIIQPLLMMKQTFEAWPFDAGALKLDGPNVSFTNPAQFLSYKPRKPSSSFRLGLGIHSGGHIELEFKAIERDTAIDVTEAVYAVREHRVVMHPGDVPPVPVHHPWFSGYVFREEIEYEVIRQGCFLGLFPLAERYVALPSPAFDLQQQLKSLIHLAGHRGTPARFSPRSTIRKEQPGLFHDRVASTIAAWIESSDARLDMLNEALLLLGITWKAHATVRDAVSVEVMVGRTVEPVRGGARDLVSIADVGFGVSQSLPVVVALIAAEPDQLVYIEQPEIHLHPRAQRAMADLISEAVRRGVRIILETHSDIILTRLQWHVARSSKRISPNDVVAHWFSRDPRTGATSVATVSPSEAGTFGDWPSDFADVAAEVDQDFAEEAWKRLPENS